MSRGIIVSTRCLCSLTAVYEVRLQSGGAPKRRPPSSGLVSLHSPQAIEDICHAKFHVGLQMSVDYLRTGVKISYIGEASELLLYHDRHAPRMTQNPPSTSKYNGTYQTPNIQQGHLKSSRIT